MAELAATAPPALPLQFVDADQVQQKYYEAVADAVEECADDTEGQTCYICLDGADEEGLVRRCACREDSGFAHVSCLARGAQAAVQRGAHGWVRWHTCGLCRQEYHGVVRCALGWACWKAYMGRPEIWPEANLTRRDAMNQLGNGLHAASHHEDALTVRKAELVTLWRIGAPEDAIHTVQGNLANSYQCLGRNERALRLRRHVYSRRLQLLGEEHPKTLRAAYNYALSLLELHRFEEAKSLMLIMIPVAQRVLGENYDITHRMRLTYAQTLYLVHDNFPPLDDLREAVTTVEETARTARRVFGNSHPLLRDIGICLQGARAALRDREGRETQLRGRRSTSPSIGT